MGTAINRPHEVEKYDYFSPFKTVSTLGDYFKVLRLYRFPVMFRYATWYDGLDEKYNFENDLYLKEESKNGVVFCTI